MAGRPPPLRNSAPLRLCVEIKFPGGEFPRAKSAKSAKSFPFKPSNFSTFQLFNLLSQASFANFADFARVFNAEAQRRKETQRRETSRRSDLAGLWPADHRLCETLRLCVSALESSSRDGISPREVRQVRKVHQRKLRSLRALRAGWHEAALHDGVSGKMCQCESVANSQCQCQCPIG